jgi:hypothetical protein
VKKNRLKFLKNWTVQFQFYKFETEKTEPNRKKLSQIKKTEPNRFEPVFVLKNQTESKPVGLNQVFLKQNSIKITFRGAWLHRVPPFMKILWTSICVLIFIYACYQVSMNIQGQGIINESIFKKLAGLTIVWFVFYTWIINWFNVIR